MNDRATLERFADYLSERGPHALDLAILMVLFAVMLAIGAAGMWLLGPMWGWRISALLFIQYWVVFDRSGPRIVVAVLAAVVTVVFLRYPAVLGIPALVCLDVLRRYLPRPASRRGNRGER